MTAEGALVDITNTSANGVGSCPNIHRPDTLAGASVDVLMTDLCTSAPPASHRQRREPVEVEDVTPSRKLPEKLKRVLNGIFKSNEPSKRPRIALPEDRETKVTRTNQRRCSFHCFTGSERSPEVLCRRARSMVLVWLPWRLIMCCWLR